MRRTLLAFIMATFAAATGATGLGATDRMYVDGVSIDPKTGSVTLLLVINFPLEDGLTKARAKSKILSYYNWMQSKKFAQAYPQAKPGSGRILIISHLAPKNSLGTSVLDQVSGYARELGFSTSFNQIQTTSSHQ